MKKNVFIIGMGRYGQSLAINLHNSGHNVTVIDVDEKLVNLFSTSYNFAGALIFDSTNLDALESTAIKLADWVVVAMSSVEHSILTCVNLRDLGIRNITAKAQNKTHKRVLKSLGIKDVIFPEDEAANQTAFQILNDDVVILAQGKETSIIKLTVTSEKLTKKTVKSISNQYFKVFALIHNEPNAKTQYMIDDEVIKKLDKLYIICANDKIKVAKKLFVNE